MKRKIVIATVFVFMMVALMPAGLPALINNNLPAPVAQPLQAVVTPSTAQAFPVALGWKCVIIGVGGFLVGSGITAIHKNNEEKKAVKTLATPPVAPQPPMSRIDKVVQDTLNTRIN